MKVNVYTPDDFVHTYALRAMYEGCPFEKEMLRVTEYTPSDIAVVFGTFKSKISTSYPRGHIIREQKRAGRDVVVLDSGYLRRGMDKDSYYMVGINGLNGRADFRNLGCPDDRFKALGIEVKPMREDGNHILLCGQVPWDASVDHIDIGKWLEDAVTSIQNVTNRPIVFRPHPKYSQAIVGRTVHSRDKLSDDFKDCWAVVTFSSNTAVEAAIEGIPVFAFDEGSMALPVANTTWEALESPELPDRTQWLNNLAYAQWTPEEMRQGLPWKHLYAADLAS